MTVLAGCKPRKEVLKGDLDDAIFAADFGDLIEGKAPAVYGNPKTFFQNTHPALLPGRSLPNALNADGADEARAAEGWSVKGNSFLGRVLET